MQKKSEITRNKERHKKHDQKRKQGNTNKNIKHNKNQLEQVSETVKQDNNNSSNKKKQHKHKTEKQK